MPNEEQIGTEENLETQIENQEPVKQWGVVREDEPSSYAGEKLTILGEDNPDDTVITPPATNEEVVTPPASTEEIVTPPATEIPAATTQAEIDDIAVLNYLKEKGFSAEKLEDLKPKESIQLDPEMEKYLEYKKDTGRS